MHTYESGEVHHFFGKQYPLQISQGRKDAVRCESGCLMVTSKNAAEPGRTEQLLNSRTRLQAVRKRASKSARLMQEATKDLSVNSNDLPLDKVL